MTYIIFSLQLQMASNHYHLFAAGPITHAVDHCNSIELFYSIFCPHRGGIPSLVSDFSILKSWVCLSVILVPFSICLPSTF